jgi:hypothetical protein
MVCRAAILRRIWLKRRKTRHGDASAYPPVSSAILPDAPGAWHDAWHGPQCVETDRGRSRDPQSSNPDHVHVGSESKLSFTVPSLWVRT